MSHIFSSAQSILVSISVKCLSIKQNTLLTTNKYICAKHWDNRQPGRRKADGSVLCSRYSVIDAAEREVGGEKKQTYSKVNYKHDDGRKMMGGKTRREIIWQENETQ